MPDFSEISNLIFTALKFVSEDRYDEAENIIESLVGDKEKVSEITEYDWQFVADIYLAMGKFELAKNAYIKAKNSIGIAFTLILLRELSEASNVLSNADASPAKNWFTFLLGLFMEKNTAEKWPTFLNIRHFLEFTVYYLLLSKNSYYIELLLKKLNELLDINLDSEKLIGYAYLNSGTLDEAKTFLENALMRNPVDGEIHFMLGKLYFMKNCLHEALNVLESARLLLPEHLPIKELLEKTKKMCL